jgi:hypothetical protein
VKLVSFGGAFFILPGERGVVAKEGLWMVLLIDSGARTTLSDSEDLLEEREKKWVIVGAAILGRQLHCWPNGKGHVIGFVLLHIM